MFLWLTVPPLSAGGALADLYGALSTGAAVCDCGGFAFYFVEFSKFAGLHSKNTSCIPHNACRQIENTELAFHEFDI